MIIIIFPEKIVSCSLEEIFAFATGASKPPLLGFESGNVPTIEFLDTHDWFPKANTCGLVLKVPTCHNTYDVFKEKFIYGIKEGMVFGFE